MCFLDPGGIYVPRTNWYDMCQLVVRKEISPQLNLKRIQRLEPFNFWSPGQDPRSHAAPIVFLAWGENTEELMEEILKKGQFFSSMPEDIMDIKARGAISPSSHEIMFKAAMAVLIKDPAEKTTLNLEVLNYQREHC